MKQTSYKIKLQFIEPLLGSASNNRELHAEFIAAKAETVEQSTEEVEALPPGEEFEKAMTVFPRFEGFPHIWDYQVRGFFKESIGVLIELGDCKLSKWGYKKAVDSLLFINPRRIFLLQKNGERCSGEDLETLQRPLRADTMRGERVALATSEVLPVGTKIEFVLKLLSGNNTKSKMAIMKEEDIKNCLEYGAMKGFGQWRSGGYGRFEYSMEEMKAKA